MSASEAGGTPQTQPAFFGPPPRPPKITARGLEDQPDDNRRIYLSEPVVVQDLAAALNVKAFKIVARLLEMRQFRHANESINFETASIIAKEYGYRAERLLPGSF